ncbi:hypothetical protein [Deinococcus aestuarii]|uniref:hypothetical protein n=1 Tax=Deinococcus aestuarii TaxID=2774531 RepID=UPI001C0D5D04|nr:hypothetical protein [Deinococcus aestuarii]
MAYTLEAVLLDAQAASFEHGLPTISLPHAVTLIPITDEVLDEHFGQADPGTSGPFWKLSASMETFLAEASRSGVVAYVEADYFGGSRTQVAAVWREGRQVMGPECSDGAGTINHALRLLGVPRSAGQDEFDAVGLGRFRHTAD